VTTTADEAALLAAIRTHPAEDTPRLAYADWLDENAADVKCYDCRGKGRVQVLDGLSDYDRSPAVCDYCSGTGRVSDGRRERAEFVRLQIRIAGLRAFCGCGSCTAFRGGGQHHNGPCAVGRERDEQPDGTSRPAMLRPREFELWRGWHKRWFGQGTGTDNFGSALTPNEVDPRVRRGFVAEVRMPAAAFFHAAKGLFSAHPIERVFLTDREPEGIGYDTFWRWFMADEVISDDPAVLPGAIWRLFHDLPPYFTSSVRRMLGWEFASRDEALAALSTACVAYGRGLAGLPPFTS